jgi:hypothetical protein
MTYNLKNPVDKYGIIYSLITANIIRLPGVLNFTHFTHSFSL